ncbi:MAG TPA: hypothetical protein VFO80_02075 [Sphingomonas sp.]|nr:hypothetical protein [Sphingomonas sp.]
MSALLALLATAGQSVPAVPVVPPAAPSLAPPTPTPPADWSAVPPLPWRVAPQSAPELDAFVQRTVATEHCPVATSRIVVEVAVFLRSDGLPRAVVPRAIDCPTVEQFAAGLVSSLARNNIRLPASGWYRTTITFDWTR